MLTEQHADYDYSGKMRSVREQWSTVDVQSVTVMAPIHYKDTLQAIALMSSAELLMSKLAARDPAIMESFAQRRLKFGFRDIDIDLLERQIDSSDEVLLADIKRLRDLIREQREARIEANVSAEKGMEAATMYWFAREYAIVYYARGAFKLLKQKIAGCDLAMRFDI